MGRYSSRRINVIGGSGWKRQRLYVAGHYGNNIRLKDDYLRLPILGWCSEIIS